MPPLPQAPGLLFRNPWPEVGKGVWHPGWDSLAKSRPTVLPDPGSSARIDL